VQKLKGYQNKIFQKMVGFKRKDESGEFRLLQNEELCD
jgi:hypothetical protein